MAKCREQANAEHHRKQTCQQPGWGGWWGFGLFWGVCVCFSEEDLSLICLTGEKVTNGERGAWCGSSSADVAE